MADAPSTFYADLLERLANIDRGIDLSAYSVALESYPHYYTNVNKGPFPKTVHRISGIDTDPISFGQNFWKETVTVSKILVAGPVGAGYDGQNEAMAYKLIRPILDAYYANQSLSYPNPSDAFRYLIVGERVRIRAPNGVAVLKFDPASNEYFFAAEFVMSMTFQIKQGRIS